MKMWALKWPADGDDPERFLYLGPHMGDGAIIYNSRREARERLAKLKDESTLYEDAFIAPITILEDHGCEVRHWPMLPGDHPKPPCTLVLRPKRKGEYFRQVMFTIPLYEGLIQVFEQLADSDLLHKGWPAEWLYYHLLKLAQREVAAARKRGDMVQP